MKEKCFDIWKCASAFGVLLWVVVGEGEIEHEADGDEWSVEIALAASEGMLVFLEELGKELGVLDVVVVEDGGDVVPDPVGVNRVEIGGGAEEDNRGCYENSESGFAH